MMNLCEAIAKIEGFGASMTNRPTRNNNPGDIEYGQFAIQHGATRVEVTPDGEQPRFAFFPDVATGYAAMKALLLGRYRGFTLQRLIWSYAPPVENDTYHYIGLVCTYTGMTPNTVIDNYLG